MRILFSSTRGAGHLQPLLPYARALVARGHEVAVAAPEEVSTTLRDAGLPHLPNVSITRGTTRSRADLARGCGDRRFVTEAERMTIGAGGIFAGVTPEPRCRSCQAMIRDVGLSRPRRSRLCRVFAAMKGACGTRASRSTRCRSKRCFLRSWARRSMPCVDGRRAHASRRWRVADAPGRSSRRSPTSLDRVPDGSRMRAPLRARAVSNRSRAARPRRGPRRDHARARLHHVREHRREHRPRPPLEITTAPRSTPLSIFLCARSS